MSVHTRSQRLAQAAFPRIQNRHSNLNEKQFKDYVSFTKKFPALVHTCGVIQAVVFAQAKGKSREDRDEQKSELLYLEDLSAVLSNCGHAELDSVDKLAKAARDLPLSGYLRLSRDTINAASWLKRYAEALGEKD